MAAPSSSASTDYYKDDDSAFIEALHDLPIGSQPTGSQTSEQPPPVAQPTPGTHTLPFRVDGLVDDDEMEMPPPAQPCLKRRRMSDASEEDDGIGSSHHQVLTSVDEGKNTLYLSNDTYGPSKFGNFGQYMSRKRAKLQIQNAELDVCDERSSRKGIFHGLQIYVRFLINFQASCWTYVDKTDQWLDTTFGSRSPRTHHTTRWHIPCLSR